MEKYPQLIALTKNNEGHGATVQYGYRYAIEEGADYIFQTDSDGQTLPEEFPKFWRHRNRAAMVIGNLPDPGIEPTSLVFRALAGVFFTTSATWEAPQK